VIPFIFTLVRFVNSIWRSLRDPEFQALSSLVAMTLLSGTLFYRSVEGWSLLDSLYFCVATLTTVGYGDFYPTTPYGKIFTIFYLFVGVGLIAAFVGKVATETIKPKHRPTPEDENRPTEENPRE
jgi:voltage-gated potassium channel